MSSLNKNNSTTATAEEEERQQSVASTVIMTEYRMSDERDINSVEVQPGTSAHTSAERSVSGVVPYGGELIGPPWGSQRPSEKRVLTVSI